MENLAGTGDTTAAALELSMAGILVEKVPAYGECKVEVIGKEGPWTLKRLWYYWSATTQKGPHKEHVRSFDSVWGDVVRAHGFAGGDALDIMGCHVRCFHIDTLEGLQALRKFLNDGTVSTRPGT